MSFLRTVDIHESIIVDGPQIAGPQPTIRHFDFSGLLRILVVAKKNIGAHDLQLAIIIGAHTHTRPGLTNGTDAIRILPVDDHRSRGFRHTVPLNERDAIHAIEEVGKVDVQRGAARMPDISGSDQAQNEWTCRRRT